MDIGGKIIFIKYLKDKNINYKNLLFLHSKSNTYKRKLYFNPLIKNLDLIIRKIKNYELVVPKKMIHIDKMVTNSIFFIIFIFVSFI